MHKSENVWSVLALLTRTRTCTQRVRFLDQFSAYGEDAQQFACGPYTRALYTYPEQTRPCGVTFLNFCGLVLPSPWKSVLPVRQNFSSKTAQGQKKIPLCRSLGSKLQECFWHYPSASPPTPPPQCVGITLICRI